MQILQAHIIRSLLYLLWAAACQLTGSYYLWEVMRGHKSMQSGILGAALIVASAMIMGLMHLPYSRAFAGYAGMLVIMSLVWGFRYKNVRPDMLDIVGGIMVLGGIGIIILTPRQ